MLCYDVYCVYIPFVLLIWTVCLRDEAEERDMERWVQGLKIIIQISENESVPNPLFPICVPPQHHHSLAFLFLRLFLIPPLGD